MHGKNSTHRTHHTLEHVSVGAGRRGGATDHLRDLGIVDHILRKLWLLSGRNQAITGSFIVVVLVVRIASLNAHLSSRVVYQLPVTFTMSPLHQPFQVTRAIR